MKLVWLVPLFPLLGFLINGFMNKKLSKSLVGIVGSGALLLSFITAVLIFVDLRNNPQLTAYTVDLFTWEKFDVDFRRNAALSNSIVSIQNGKNSCFIIRRCASINTPIITEGCTFTWKIKKLPTFIQ